MAGIKNLLQVIWLAYGRKTRLPSLYNQLCYKSVHNRYKKTASASSVSYRSVCKIPIESLSYLLEKEKKNIIELAEHCMNNEFNYLGSGWVKMNPVRWSSDFVHDFDWLPGTYYQKYTQISDVNNADVKLPRELCRCHFLLHLAIAFQLTKDNKYADKVYELINDWIDNNPLMYSINWGCAMDVAIRAVNWIWALALLEDYKTADNIQGKIKTSLLEHGWFIYRNLEGHMFNYNHNHYFSDIVGLVHIGLLFKDCEDGKKWLTFSLKEFYREVRLQILPSGITFELTTNYNRLMMELITPTLILLKRNNFSVPIDIEGRLEAMYDFVNKTSMPDGTMPIIGDQDNGRGLPFGSEDVNDYRYLLSLGATLFGRPDFKSRCDGYNAYCAIFGEIDSYTSFNALTPIIDMPSSRLFRDAGLAVMQYKNNYLLFNFANQGFYTDADVSTSHTHADLYSFVLAAKGVPFIVDPGTYVYTSDFKMRNMFRSTAMHNTVVVDGKSQEDIPERALWDIRRKACSKLESWSTSENQDYVSAIHNSYRVLKDPVIHRRSLTVNKEDNSWQISDVLDGNDIHSVDLHFHLDEGVTASLHDNIVSLNKSGVKLAIAFEAPTGYQVAIVPTKLSKSYGTIMDSQEILLTVECKLPITINTIITNLDGKA